MHPVNELIIAFEEHVGLATPGAARLLGIGRSTYTHYRSGERDLPEYHRKHIDVLMRVSERLLRELIKESIDG